MASAPGRPGVAAEERRGRRDSPPPPADDGTPEVDSRDAGLPRSGADTWADCGDTRGDTRRHTER